MTNEYDLLRDHEHSEWYIVDLRTLKDINVLFENDLQVDPNEQDDPVKWFDYAKFCLGYDMTEKAELLMHKYIGIVGLDSRLDLIMGAMNLQNGKNKEASQHLHSILEQDWEHIQANLLMGFMYKAIGRPGLSRKHFAIAKVKRMRELSQLQPKNNAPKNFRT